MRCLVQNLVVALGVALSVGCSGSGGGGGGSGSESVVVISGPTQVTRGPRNDEDPSLIRTSDGKYLLAWFTETNSLGDLWLQSSNDGVEWSPLTPILQNSDRSYYPALVQTSDDTFHVASFRIESGTQNFNIQYQSSNDLRSWSDPETVTTDSGIDWAPAVIEVDGTVWIFWSSNRSGNKEIYASSRMGGVWSAPLRITNNPNDDEFAYVLRLQDGSFLLVWTRLPAGSDYTSDTRSEIYFSTSRDLVSWSSATAFTRDTGAGFVDILPTAFLDRGEPHIAWTTNREDPRGSIVEAPLSDPENILTLVTGSGANYSSKIAPGDGDHTFLMAWVSDRNGNSSNRDIFTQEFQLPK